MTTLRTLLAEAHTLNVTVHRAHLPDGRLGYYDHAARQVVVSLALTQVQFLCTLAHECAHAFYGDACESGAGDRRARKRAAALLIDPAHYVAAERIDPSLIAIADELGVTPKVVEDYRRYWLEGRTLSASHP